MASSHFEVVTQQIGVDGSIPNLPQVHFHLVALRCIIACSEACFEGFARFARVGVGFEKCRKFASFSCRAM